MNRDPEKAWEDVNYLLSDIQHAVGLLNDGLGDLFPEVLESVDRDRVDPLTYLARQIEAHAKEADKLHQEYMKAVRDGKASAPAAQSEA